MNTYINCIPCFYKQILNASRMAGLEDKEIKNISKGQGNFESLSDPDKNIFYLFMTKCEKVAHITESKKGSINLYFLKR